MTSFELKSSSCDGHIKALSKAVIMASRISREALLEFKPDKLRLCARTDMVLVKFVFNKDFFTEYHCNNRHRCFISLKALQMPFKSSILVSDKDSSLRSQVKIKCFLEDEVNNQIVFKIGSEPPSATLTYRLTINDIDPLIMTALNNFNRKIHYSRVTIAPKQSKKERFLLSAFNSFLPEIDQVTIRTNQNEVKFIGSCSPSIHSGVNTTSEFTHNRDDFSHYDVKEDTTITVPLRYLKLFLNFVETNRVQTFPKYVFEGMGLPAHFIYDAQLFKGHYMSATPYEYMPEQLEESEILPITMGPNESFIADENVIQGEDEDDEDLFGPTFNNDNARDNDENDYEDDFDDNGNNSDGSGDLLDGNLEGLNPSLHNSTFPNASLYGTESIRSEMTDNVTYDAAKLREILNLDEDPDEIENVVIQYSSDSGEE